MLVEQLLYELTNLNRSRGKDMHFLHLMYSKRFVEMYPRVSRAILAYNSDQYNRHFHGNSFCTRLWWVLTHRQMTGCVGFFFFFPTLCLWAMGLWVLWLNLAACAGVCVLKAGFPAKVLLLSQWVLFSIKTEIKAGSTVLFIMWIPHVGQTQLLVLFSITPHRHSLTKQEATILNP